MKVYDITLNTKCIYKSKPTQCIRITVYKHFMFECPKIFGSTVVFHHFLADITSSRLAASLRPTLLLAPCLWAQGLSRPGRPLWLRSPPPENTCTEQGTSSRPPWRWLAAQKLRQRASVWGAWLSSPSHSNTFLGTSHERTPCVIKLLATSLTRACLLSDFHTAVYTAYTYRHVWERWICVIIRLK